MLKQVFVNDKEVYTQDEILKETKSFYERLYSKRKIENVHLNNIFSTCNIPRLNISQQIQLEGPLTYKKCFATFKKMGNNK